MNKHWFYDAFDDLDFGFTSDTGAWQMTVLAEYDTSKITLKWYVNGVEDESKQNQKSVTFNRPSANDPRIILDWSNEEVCNYFFKAFVRITSKTTFEVDRETTLFFSDQTQIHMTLFDSSAGKDDGFDTSPLVQGKVFEVGPKDMYIDIHGLPHTYKYDRMIGNTISSQMGNYLCPVLRKGAYYLSLIHI